MSDEIGEDAAEGENRVGDILREARESRGMSLEEIAKSTRVPMRHLENIENGDYTDLPAPTYSTGFVKAYARAVGLNQETVGQAFRDEIQYRTTQETTEDYFEPADPSRVPPRSLAWIAAAIAIILAIAYALWRSGTFGLDGDDRARLAAGTDQPVASAAADSAADTPRAAARRQPAAAATGPVILEAQDVVWLRVYDLESGDRIFESELQPGETYEVPADAEHPAIRTARAEGLSVTVGGRRVAPLGPPETVIADVSLLPADLARRRAPVRPPGDE